LRRYLPSKRPLRPRPAQQAGAASRGGPGRRDDIKYLEGLLTMAVKSGADKLALQMRASEPGSLFA
jgi:hypothetical protein